MKIFYIPIVKSSFTVLAVILPASNCFAVLEKFHPYVYTRALYDSNIFRLSGDQQAIAILGDDKRDDTIGHLGVGLKSDLKLSRQHLLADILVDRSKYDKFGELDHTRIDGRGTWKWGIGNLWSGILEYRYRDELSSFNQRLSAQKDMRNEQKGEFNAAYQVHPDWQLLAGLSYSDVSFEERKRLNRETTSNQFEIQYRNTLNTRVGVRARYSNYDLRDSSVAGSPVSNDYDEVEISGVFYWQGSGVSALEAKFGYTDLKYDDLNDRDFRGSTGQLTYLWELTGKTRIDFSAWRKTSSLSDEVTNYVLTKGVSIKPTWLATRKISVFGEASFTNDDFKGANEVGVALGVPKRKDDTWLYSIGLRWNPIRHVQTSVNYRYEDRDSTIDARDFTDNQVGARVQYNF